MRVEVVVECPESRNAWATLEPTRKSLGIATPGNGDSEAPRKQAKVAPPTSEQPVATVEPPAALLEPELREQHFTIRYGETGHSYESIVGPYLKGASELHVEDPYIRLTHQVQNFVRFCEAVVKLSAVKKIRLVTNYDNQEQLTEVQQKFEELTQSLLEMDIVLEIKLNPNLHDREIRIDNGWVVKIGRGLDFYQRPANWFEIGVNDLALRKCLETKVDIYRSGTAS
ncbi:MIT C-terminal domain-containing protein [Lacipirellula limnantheis]|uniref:MIT C-terminal domain-containing protein n=1 Tax=Lacipirellula limnantheis TaxID=2528024 RepID=UPI001AEF548B|nr:MIT C-terminal domain-containing protein [Lacipirellula limnantheis]